MEIVDQAIADLDDLSIHYHMKEALRRLQAKLDKTVEERDHNAARALIEKIHLVAGNRRMKHLSVTVDRRYGNG